MYKITNELIGTGSFSNVYIGFDENNNKIAVKKMEMITLRNVEFDENKILNEIDIMAKFNHINIVKYLNSERIDMAYYIYLEYCNCGTIDNIVNYNKIMSINSEYNTIYYLKQLNEALKYMQNLGYVHRDIKPQNILLTSNSPNNGDYSYKSGIILKLSDFGLAKYNTNIMLNTTCGSPLCMAPEILNGMQYNDGADIWSYGIVMYYILYGKYLFYGNSIDQLKKNIKNNKPIVYNNISNYGIDLLEKILVINPMKRIKWYDLYNHSWFTEVKPIEIVENKFNPVIDNNLSILKYNFDLSYLTNF